MLGNMYDIWRPIYTFVPPTPPVPLCHFTIFHDLLYVSNPEKIYWELIWLLLNDIQGIVKVLPSLSSFFT